MFTMMLAEAWSQTRSFKAAQVIKFLDACTLLRYAFSHNLSNTEFGCDIASTLHSHFGFGQVHSLLVSSRVSILQVKSV